MRVKTERVSDEPNARSPAPTPADYQQMDRSNEPELTAEMKADAAKAAMASRRQRLTGTTVGVGSVEFDDPRCIRCRQGFERACEPARQR